MSLVESLASLASLGKPAKTELEKLLMHDFRQNRLSLVLEQASIAPLLSASLLSNH